MTKLMLG